MSGHGITGLGERAIVAQAWGDVLTMDSGSSLQSGDEGCNLVAGSHCSEMAARFIVPFAPRAVILHDAGGGKDGCGIAGLHVFAVFGIPAAAVDCASAMIGHGADVYENGRISASNALAGAAGVAVGMPAKEAMKRMAEAAAGAPQGHVGTIGTANGGKAFLADTASFLDTRHGDAVCVVGSHGSDIVAHHLIALRARAAFANDAGGGKNNAGFSGLALLAGAGIPAAVYDCNSARIGDAQDAWAHGVLSHINPPGQSLGWLVGMPVADAVAMVPVR